MISNYAYLCLTLVPRRRAFIMFVHDGTIDENVHLGELIFCLMNCHFKREIMFSYDVLHWLYEQCRDKIPDIFYLAYANWTSYGHPF